MKVNKRQLAIILWTHCIVNIKADGKVLKYRYCVDPKNPKRHVWFCNGKITGISGGTDLIQYLTEKYKDIEVTYKRQF